MTTQATPDTRSAARPAHLGLALVLAAVGFVLVAPTRLDIAVLLREVLHSLGVTSLAAAGLLSTATLLGDGVTEMLTGHVSDRWGRANTLVIGIVFFSVFSILSGLVASLATLYVVRILLGVGQAIFLPAYFAFVGGIYGRRRGLLLGTLGGLFTVGLALNDPLTAGMFRASGAWQTPFIVYGVFGFVLAIGIYAVGRSTGGVYETKIHVLTPPPDAHPGSWTAWLHSRNMRLLLATMLLWGLTQYGFLGLRVTYLRSAEHFSLGDAVLVASVGGWVAFIFSFFAGYLSDHIGRRWTLLICGGISVIAVFLFFVLPQTLMSALILSAIFQAGNGCFFPVGVAYAQDFARADALGAHTGAVIGIGHLAAGVSGLIAGALAGHFGFTSLGWYFGIASIVMLVPMAMTREPRFHAQQEPAGQPEAIRAAS
jgi:MFS family permease